MTRNPESGLFIVVEGIDGTGKTTQVKMLADSLAAAEHTVIRDREPSDGPYGKLLRDSATTGRMTAQEELDLFHKDRRQHVDEVIIPALNQGKIVILDRYYFSTMAYQGQRGFDRAELRAINESFAPVPDILFILDLPVDTALDRIGARGDTANEFEQRDALQFCRDTFLSVSTEPYAHVIDSSPSPESIHQKMLDIAKSILKNQIKV